MRHHAPSPAYLNIFEFHLFQGNASWRHHNLRSLSILTEAYCPLWYKEGMFFPCVVEPAKKKTSFSHHAMQSPDARNFQMQRVSRRSHREQCQVGKQDFRTQAHVPNKMRQVSIWSFCLPYVSSIFKQTCWNHTYYVLESLHPLPAFSVSIRNQCFGL